MPRFPNDAILGMRKAEMDRRFDEMVALVETAHLEPETLLVDEVLAVRDAAFPKGLEGDRGRGARGADVVGEPWYGCRPGVW